MKLVKNPTIVLALLFVLTCNLSFTYATAPTCVKLGSKCDPTAAAGSTGACCGGICGLTGKTGKTFTSSYTCMIPPSCRMVGTLMWCTDASGVIGKTCTETCASVSLAPLADHTAWFDAQDTVEECTAIRDAFGLTLPVTVGDFGAACAESQDGPFYHEFVCSTSSFCPQSANSEADALYLHYCPCQ